MGGRKGLTTDAFYPSRCRFLGKAEYFSSKIWKSWKSSDFVLEIIQRYPNPHIYIYRDNSSHPEDYTNPFWTCHSSGTWLTVYRSPNIIMWAHIHKKMQIPFSCVEICKSYRKVYEQMQRALRHRCFRTVGNPECSKKTQKNISEPHD